MLLEGSLCPADAVNLRLGLVCGGFALLVPRYGGGGPSLVRPDSQGPRFARGSSDITTGAPRPFRLKGTPILGGLRKVTDNWVNPQGIEWGRGTLIGIPQEDPNLRKYLAGKPVWQTKTTKSTKLISKPSIYARVASGMEDLVVTRFDPRDERWKVDIIDLMDTEKYHRYIDERGAIDRSSYGEFLEAQEDIGKNMMKVVAKQVAAGIPLTIVEGIALNVAGAAFAGPTAGTSAIASMTLTMQRINKLRNIIVKGSQAVKVAKGARRLGRGSKIIASTDEAMLGVLAPLKKESPKVYKKAKEIWNKSKAYDVPLSDLGPTNPVAALHPRVKGAIKGKQVLVKDASQVRRYLKNEIGNTGTGVSKRKKYIDAIQNYGVIGATAGFTQETAIQLTRPAESLDKERILASTIGGAVGDVVALKAMRRMLGKMGASALTAYAKHADEAAAKGLNVEKGLNEWIEDEFIPTLTKKDKARILSSSITAGAIGGGLAGAAYGGVELARGEPFAVAAHQTLMGAVMGGSIGGLHATTQLLSPKMMAGTIANEAQYHSEKPYRDRDIRQKAAERNYVDGENEQVETQNFLAKQWTSTVQDKAWARTVRSAVRSIFGFGDKEAPGAFAKGLDLTDAGTASIFGTEGQMSRRRSSLFDMVTAFAEANTQNLPADDPLRQAIQSISDAIRFPLDENGQPKVISDEHKNIFNDFLRESTVRATAEIHDVNMRKIFSSKSPYANAGTVMPGNMADATATMNQVLIDPYGADPSKRLGKDGSISEEDFATFIHLGHDQVLNEMVGMYWMEQFDADMLGDYGLDHIARAQNRDTHPKRPNEDNGMFFLRSLISKSYKNEKNVRDFAKSYLNNVRTALADSKTVRVDADGNEVPPRIPGQADPSGLSGPSRPATATVQKPQDHAIGRRHVTRHVALYQKTHDFLITKMAKLHETLHVPGNAEELDRLRMMLEKLKSTEPFTFPQEFFTEPNTVGRDPDLQKAWRMSDDEVRKQIIEENILTKDEMDTVLGLSEVEEDVSRRSTITETQTLLLETQKQPAATGEHTPPTNLLEESPPKNVSDTHETPPETGQLGLFPEDVTTTTVETTPEQESLIAGINAAKTEATETVTPEAIAAAQQADLEAAKQRAAEIEKRRNENAKNTQELRRGAPEAGIQKINNDGVENAGYAGPVNDTNIAGISLKDSTSVIGLPDSPLATEGFWQELQTRGHMVTGRDIRVKYIQNHALVEGEAPSEASGIRSGEVVSGDRTVIVSDEHDQWMIFVPKGKGRASSTAIGRFIDMVGVKLAAPLIAQSPSGDVIPTGLSPTQNREVARRLLTTLIYAATEGPGGRDFVLHVSPEIISRDAVTNKPIKGILGTTDTSENISIVGLSPEQLATNIREMSDVQSRLMETVKRYGVDSPVVEDILAHETAHILEGFLDEGDLLEFRKLYLSFTERDHLGVWKNKDAEVFEKLMNENGIATEHRATEFFAWQIGRRLFRDALKSAVTPQQKSLIQKIMSLLRGVYDSTFYMLGLRKKEDPAAGDVMELIYSKLVKRAYSGEEQRSIGKRSLVSDFTADVVTVSDTLNFDLYGSSFNEGSEIIGTPNKRLHRVLDNPPVFNKKADSPARSRETLLMLRPNEIWRTSQEERTLMKQQGEPVDVDDAEAARLAAQEVGDPTVAAAVEQEAQQPFGFNRKQDEELARVETNEAIAKELESGAAPETPTISPFAVGADYEYMGGTIVQPFKNERGDRIARTFFTAEDEAAEAALFDRLGTTAPLIHKIPRLNFARSMDMLRQNLAAIKEWPGDPTQQMQIFSRLSYNLDAINVLGKTYQERYSELIRSMTVLSETLETKDVMARFESELHNLNQQAKQFETIDAHVLAAAEKGEGLEGPPYPGITPELGLAQPFSNWVNEGQLSFDDANELVRTIYLAAEANSWNIGKDPKTDPELIKLAAQRERILRDGGSRQKTSSALRALHEKRQAYLSFRSRVEESDKAVIIAEQRLGTEVDRAYERTLARMPAEGHTWNVDVFIEELGILESLKDATTHQMPEDLKPILMEIHNDRYKKRLRAYEIAEMLYQNPVTGEEIRQARFSDLQKELDPVFPYQGRELEVVDLEEQTAWAQKMNDWALEKAGGRGQGVRSTDWHQITAKELAQLNDSIEERPLTDVEKGIAANLIAKKYVQIIKADQIELENARALQESLSVMKQPRDVTDLQIQKAQEKVYEIDRQLKEIDDQGIEQDPGAFALSSDSIRFLNMFLRWRDTSEGRNSGIMNVVDMPPSVSKRLGVANKDLTRAQLQMILAVEADPEEQAAYQGMYLGHGRSQETQRAVQSIFNYVLASSLDNPELRKRIYQSSEPLVEFSNVLGDTAKRYGKGGWVSKNSITVPIAQFVQASNMGDDIRRFVSNHMDDYTILAKYSMLDMEDALKLPSKRLDYEIFQEQLTRVYVTWMRDNAIPDARSAGFNHAFYLPLTSRGLLNRKSMKSLMRVLHDPYGAFEADQELYLSYFSDAISTWRAASLNKIESAFSNVLHNFTLDDQVNPTILDADIDVSHILRDKQGNDLPEIRGPVSQLGRVAKSHVSSQWVAAAEWVRAQVGNQDQFIIDAENLLLDKFITRDIDKAIATRMINYIAKSDQTPSKEALMKIAFDKDFTLENITLADRTIDNTPSASRIYQGMLGDNMDKWGATHFPDVDAAIVRDAASRHQKPITYLELAQQAETADAQFKFAYESPDKNLDKNAQQVAIVEAREKYQEARNSLHERQEAILGDVSEDIADRVLDTLIVHVEDQQQVRQQSMEGMMHGASALGMEDMAPEDGINALTLNAESVSDTISLNMDNPQDDQNQEALNRFFVLNKKKFDEKKTVYLPAHRIREILLGWIHDEARNKSAPKQSFISKAEQLKGITGIDLFYLFAEGQSRLDAMPDDVLVANTTKYFALEESSLSTEQAYKDEGLLMLIDEMLPHMTDREYLGITLRDARKITKYVDGLLDKLAPAAHGNSPFHGDGLSPKDKLTIQGLSRHLSKLLHSPIEASWTQDKEFVSADTLGMFMENLLVQQYASGHVISGQPMPKLHEHGQLPVDANGVFVPPAPGVKVSDFTVDVPDIAGGRSFESLSKNTILRVIDELANPNSVLWEGAKGKSLASPDANTKSPAASWAYDHWVPFQRRWNMFSFLLKRAVKHSTWHELRKKSRPRWTKGYSWDRLRVQMEMEPGAGRHPYSMPHNPPSLIDAVHAAIDDRSTGTPLSITLPDGSLQQQPRWFGQKWEGLSEQAKKKVLLLLEPVQKNTLQLDAEGRPIVEDLPAIAFFEDDRAAVMKDVRKRVENIEDWRKLEGEQLTRQQDQIFMQKILESEEAKGAMRKMSRDILMEQGWTVSQVQELLLKNDHEAVFSQVVEQRMGPLEAAEGGLIVKDPDIINSQIISELDELGIQWVDVSASPLILPHVDRSGRFPKQVAGHYAPDNVRRTHFMAEVLSKYYDSYAKTTSLLEMLPADAKTGIIGEVGLSEGAMRFRQEYLNQNPDFRFPEPPSGIPYGASQYQKDQIKAALQLQAKNPITAAMRMYVLSMGRDAIERLAKDTPDNRVSNEYDPYLAHYHKHIEGEVENYRREQGSTLFKMGGHGEFEDGNGAVRVPDGDQLGVDDPGTGFDVPDTRYDAEDTTGFFSQIGPSIKGWTEQYFTPGSHYISEKAGPLGDAWNHFLRVATNVGNVSLYDFGLDSGPVPLKAAMARVSVRLNDTLQGIVDKHKDLGGLGAGPTTNDALLDTLLSQSGFNPNAERWDVRISEDIPRGDLWLKDSIEVVKYADELGRSGETGLLPLDIDAETFARTMTMVNEQLKSRVEYLHKNQDYAQDIWNARQESQHALDKMHNHMEDADILRFRFEDLDVVEDPLTYKENYVSFSPSKWMHRIMMTWSEAVSRVKPDNEAHPAAVLAKKVDEDLKLATPVVFESTAQFTSHLPRWITLVLSTQEPHTGLMTYSQSTSNLIGEYRAASAMKAFLAHPNNSHISDLAPETIKALDAMFSPHAGERPSMRGLFENMLKDSRNYLISDLHGGEDAGTADKIIGNFKALWRNYHGSAQPLSWENVSEKRNMQQMRSLVNRLWALRADAKIKGLPITFGLDGLNEEGHVSAPPQFAEQRLGYYADLRGRGFLDQMFSGLAVTAYFGHRTSIQNLLENLFVAPIMQGQRVRIDEGSMKAFTSTFGAMMKAIWPSVKAGVKGYVRPPSASKYIDDLLKDPAKVAAIYRFADNWMGEMMNVPHGKAAGKWLRVIGYESAELASLTRTSSMHLDRWNNGLGDTIELMIQNYDTPDGKAYARIVDGIMDTADLGDHTNLQVIYALHKNMAPEGKDPHAWAMNALRDFVVSEQTLEWHHRYGALDRPPALLGNKYMVGAFYWLRSWGMQQSYKMYNHLIRKPLRKAHLLEKRGMLEEAKRIRNEGFKQAFFKLLGIASTYLVFNEIQNQALHSRMSNRNREALVEPTGELNWEAVQDRIVDNVLAEPPGSFGTFSEMANRWKYLKQSRSQQALAESVVSPLVSFVWDATAGIKNVIQGTFLNNPEMRRRGLTDVIRLVPGGAVLSPALIRPARGMFNAKLAGKMTMGMRAAGFGRSTMFLGDLNHRVFTKTNTFDDKSNYNNWRLVFKLMRQDDANLGNQTLNWLMGVSPDKIASLLSGGVSMTRVEAREFYRSILWKLEPDQRAPYMSSIESFLDARSALRISEQDAQQDQITISADNPIWGHFWSDILQRASKQSESFQREFILHMAMGLTVKSAKPHTVDLMSFTASETSSRFHTLKELSESGMTSFVSQAASELGVSIEDVGAYTNEETRYALLADNSNMEKVWRNAMDRNLIFNFTMLYALSPELSFGQHGDLYAGWANRFRSKFTYYRGLAEKFGDPRKGSIAHLAWKGVIRDPEILHDFQSQVAPSVQQEIIQGNRLAYTLFGRQDTKDIIDKMWAGHILRLRENAEENEADKNERAREMNIQPLQHPVTIERRQRDRSGTMSL